MADRSAPIVQVRTFEGDGFTFMFPEFEEWEVKAVQKKTPDLSIIFINWPATIEFEVAPQTAVRKVPGLVPGPGTADNPHGVACARVHDPSYYVPGYLPKPDAWDHLEFYGPVFGVRITPFRHEGHGYGAERFTRTMIDSFRFHA